ncbi:uncharacterized protein LOC120257922 [Dioscorea cayenensis subsp. rotundata]|uniref:Uncharacterized protein LOC120257922 n=1 Tax=Dioscorea cayennensis subsp. rotundata TaxID=55577 RepID=A0AB40B1E6_DIOCR|nr:uncharacterized protein LOC120257922 [Dioscorea cayenensis subsp. rotundata]
MASRPPLAPEIGPDGIARESPVIAYTEKIIEEEQLQLKRYIKENYSKIRDVERELENLTLELKLTAGPKKAALEHLRKKIELSTEKIRLAKQKEDQAKKVWEAAAQAVREEEATKQKLCDDLSQLVQESTNSQFTRLEELKRRLEALNPSRVSCDVSDVKSAQQIQSVPTAPQPLIQPASNSAGDNLESQVNPGSDGGNSKLHASKQPAPADARDKRQNLNLGKGKGNTIFPKGKASSGSAWTGAGFRRGWQDVTVGLYAVFAFILSLTSDN